MGARGVVAVYLAKLMGVVQTKEVRGDGAASSAPTPSPSTAATAPFPPPHTPPSAPVTVDLEPSDLTKPDGDVAAADAPGADPVAEGFLGSGEGDRGGSGGVLGSRGPVGVGEEEGDRGGTEDVPGSRGAEGDGEDEGDRAESSSEGGKEAAVRVGKGERMAKVGPLYPRRPGQPDCKFYVESGYCKFKADCKFNHPPNRRKGRKNDAERNGILKEGDKRIKYPLRPDATDCTFYTKTGTCKFGPSCRFNHPPDGKKNKAKVEKQSEHIKVGEKKRQTPKQGITLKKYTDVNKSKEALPKSFGQEEKHYTTPGACKFEISEHSNHRGVKKAPSVALNFLNLPIRPGAKECPQYMSEGSCKFGINCKHHHPDPTATNEPDPLSRNQEGQCIQQFGSGVSPSSGTPSYVSTSYTSGMHLPYRFYPNPEWNGYQVPMLQPEMHTKYPSTSPVNHVDNKATALMHQQAHIEYPERPGQPECQHFKKTGACKYRSLCKFHHPRNHLGKNANSYSEPK